MNRQECRRFCLECLSSSSCEVVSLMQCTQFCDPNECFRQVITWAQTSMYSCTRFPACGRSVRAVLSAEAVYNKI